MRPRIPTSCRTCEIFPRAPENAIMYTGLKMSVSRKCVITSVFKLSFVVFQISSAFSKRSTAVLWPRLKRISFS